MILWIPNYRIAVNSEIKTVLNFKIPMNTKMGSPMWAKEVCVNLTDF